MKTIIIKALLFSALAGSSLSHADSLSNKTNPVLLVHGFEIYTVAKTDCTSKFRPMITELKKQGFTGPFVTVTYYKNSTNCDVNLAKTDTVNKASTWKEIGGALSRHIFDKYSKFGQPIDIVGHSMGGLIIRSAVQGGSEQLKGFSNILIDDAVTVATPHLGSKTANFCIYRQCKSLSPSNPDFGWLKSNLKPSGMSVIDWSVQGSTSDIVVNKKSSMAMDLSNSHKRLFNGLSHNTQLVNHASLSHVAKSLGSKKQ